MIVGGRALRLIGKDTEGALTAIETSPAVRDWQADGRLVSGRRLSPGDDPPDPVLAQHDGPIVEHDRIPFPTYPDEWTPAMLWCAGQLTLDLAEALAGETKGLKDATPFNVLWRGGRAVFVDLLSIERRDPLDALWLAEAQFARTFLLPLAAYRVAGLTPRQVFATDREGLTPEAFVRMCPWPQRWLPTYAAIATLPAKLAASNGKTPPARTPELKAATPAKAAFIFSATLKRQRRRLEALKPPTGMASAWRDYGPRQHYPADAWVRKQAFVESVLAAERPNRVIDLGCNDGTFSLMAASHGADVIAADSDIASLDTVMARAGETALTVTPLHMDLAQPTPAAGWAGRERLSFDARANGHFDIVLALAVIHHLQVSARIPLPEIARWIAAMTRKIAVVEHAGPDDPMVQRLKAARGAPVGHLDDEVFDAVFAEHFDIARTERLDGMDRRVLMLAKRT